MTSHHGRMSVDFLLQPRPAPTSTTSTASSISDAALSTAPDIISRPPSESPAFHHIPQIPSYGIMELAHAAEIASAAQTPFSPVSTNSTASSVEDTIVSLDVAAARSTGRPRTAFQPLHLAQLQPAASYIPSHQLLAARAARAGASRTHVCPTCADVFNQKVRFLHHLFSVHAWRTYDSKPILPCSRCHSAFLRNTDRSKHDACVHQKLRPHRCEAANCGSSFFFAKDLTKHRSTVHLRHKPFPCSICNKAFGKREHMTSHVKRVHQKLRPFKCEVCDIRLASKYNLQGHLKTAAHAAAETVANRDSANRAQTAMQLAS